ncbi:MAG: uroporphyrinogen decarboxylase [candidate division Zixibacteria bacterium HGW-Zixibacteria-1]|nr:MAG: uroporphyrinogen decarboxylase [candidate division Zixibacteria bacterium HGW-Zixibacteria-1]
MAIADSNFIKACYGRNDGPIPVWIMRQAGRYLPEYQAIRDKVSFLELCRTPELIAEVVRQPIARFDLDAAILFSDILTILEPMGVKIDFPDGGPEIEAPITKPEDIDRLIEFDIAAEMPYVLDGIRKIKEILPDKPLIGFAGSPFTVACYLIQGKGSKNFDIAKKFIHQYPSAAKRLIDFLSKITARYLEAQIEAGADTVQLFESWGGVLSRDDFKTMSVDAVNKIFSSIAGKNVPRILFVNNIAPYIDMIKDVDCEVVSIDYRMNLAAAARMLPGKAMQGNLDPAVLFGSVEHVREKTKALLDSVDDLSRLIFNLGHGIMVKTPIESVHTMVETVRNYRK